MPRRARRAAERLPADTPKISISPVLCTKPLTAFMSVVLPAPLVPMRPTISPGRTSIDTLSTTVRPLNSTLTSRVTNGRRASPSCDLTVANDDTVPVCVLRFGSQPVRRTM